VEEEGEEGREGGVVWGYHRGCLLWREEGRRGRRRGGGRRRRLRSLQALRVRRRLLMVEAEVERGREGGDEDHLFCCSGMIMWCGL
jgi:hypothetical protein